MNSPGKQNKWGGKHKSWVAYLGIVVWSFFFCSFHSRDNYDPPSKISYLRVPGFSPLKGNVIEWNSASVSNQKEPLVTASLAPPPGLKIRWLGTAGYELSDDSTTILIDPFVSRPTFFQLLNPLKIDTTAVKHYILAPLQIQHVKVILVSHAHYDHLQDVPYILAQFPNPEERPLVVGSQNVHDLIKKYTRSTGIEWVDSLGGLQDSPIKVLAFSPSKKSCLLNTETVSCKVGTFGRFTITAFASDHSSYDYLGPTALEGSIQSKPPYWGTGYKMQFNTSIGYLIEYQGLRIFFTESPIVKHSGKIDKVDILVQGIVSRKEYNTVSQTLASLKPEYVIPTHYDNFFKPLTEFKNFDQRIGWGPVDFSRFAQFINSFEKSYVARARRLIGQDAYNLNPKLRLMKLFYYYSLTNLLQE